MKIKTNISKLKQWVWFREMISRLLLIVKLCVFRQGAECWGRIDQITVSLSVFAVIWCRNWKEKNQDHKHSYLFNPRVLSCLSVSLWVSLTRRGKYETKPFLSLWFTYTNESSYNWSELIFFPALIELRLSLKFFKWIDLWLNSSLFSLENN